jgi:hypothetical protein
MKRSLTIGCVLLVGGGAANCGGVVTGTVPDQEASGRANASGSGPIGGGFMGDGSPHAGAGGAYVGAVGVQVGVGGGPEVGGHGDTPWIDPCADGGDQQCFLGVGGAGGDPGEFPSVGAGAGPVAGSGGESGWADEPPAGGAGPIGGSGGWIGVPPK